MASYGDSWTSKAGFVGRQQWVSMENLEQLIMALEAINFSVQTGRTQGLEMVGKLTVTTNVVSKTRRFPDDVAFIHRDGKDWPRKFTQVITALNYKPPENAFIAGNSSDKQAQNNNIARRPVATDDDKQFNLGPSEREQFNKALVAFEQGLAEMRTQIGSFIGVYDRDTFEREFYLRWVEEKKGDNGDDS